MTSSAVARLTKVGKFDSQPVDHRNCLSRPKTRGKNSFLFWPCQWQKLLYFAFGSWNTFQVTQLL